jgi:hypothetical protein
MRIRSRHEGETGRWGLFSSCCLEHHRAYKAATR